MEEEGGQGVDSEAQRGLREVPQASILKENASELAVVPFGISSLSPGNLNLQRTCTGIKGSREELSHNTSLTRCSVRS